MYVTSSSQPDEAGKFLQRIMSLESALRFYHGCFDLLIGLADTRDRRWHRHMCNGDDRIQSAQISRSSLAVCDESFRIWEAE